MIYSVRLANGALACKICGSSELRTHLHTAKCGDCGVLLRFPYPSSREIQDVICSKPELVRKWYRDSAVLSHDMFIRSLRFVDVSGAPTILDYGGGGGQFGAVIRSLLPEARVYITDPSELVLPEWESLSTRIPFGEFATDEINFDFIFLNDVFEHLQQPIEVLRCLATKLKPSGKIFIDTPRQFWLYPAAKLMQRRIYDALLRGTVSNAHLQIWSGNSFELAIKQAGLAIHKYKACCGFSMPADFYLDAMGITFKPLRMAGRVFYRMARYLARNKIDAVLVHATL